MQTSNLVEISSTFWPHIAWSPFESLSSFRVDYWARPDPVIKSVYYVQTADMMAHIVSVIEVAASRLVIYALN